MCFYSLMSDMTLIGHVVTRSHRLEEFLSMHGISQLVQTHHFSPVVISLGYFFLFIFIYISFFSPQFQEFIRPFYTVINSQHDMLPFRFSFPMKFLVLLSY